MISNTFYNKRNLVCEYLGAKVPHYAIKEPSIILDWYEHTILKGETLYNLASKIFGDKLEYMWTYIADNNPPRLVDDWKVGDIIRLPKVIVRDTETQIIPFANV